MTPTLLYRIAAGLLVLFAALHTIGFLGFKPPTAAGLAVQESMDAVRFELRGASFSYGDFYRGFGLTISVFMLFCAYLAWHLGAVAREQPRSIGALAWAFALLQLACFFLSWKFFSFKPALFSGFVFLSLAGAALLLRVGEA